MDDEKIIATVQKHYDIQIDDYKRIKGIYKIIGTDADYALKIIKYNYEHFNFIFSAIMHLKKSGLKSIPDIIKTKEGKWYFTAEGNFFYLSKWITSKNSNYDDEEELMKVVENVAVLHKFSEGFKITKDMQPRIYWFEWLKNFYIRKNEIINFKDRISQKKNKDEFDLIYCSEIKKEIEEAEKSILGLYRSKYFNIMKKQIIKKGFCHHDLANHNILISGDNSVHFIDFDYCILDSYLHDIASLAIRSNKDGRWSIQRFENIIKSYSYIQRITDEEITVLLEFIRFPQEFWQLGIQKYWEMQDYSLESYTKRLTKYLEDRDKKSEFVSYLLIR